MYSALSQERILHYIVYLDEFGHLGPFVSRTDRTHNSNPGFGLGGFALPYHRVRSLATWFYKFRNGLLRSELENSGRQAWQWEKKGAELFATKTIRRYPEIRSAGNRLINGITSYGGRIVFLAYEKQTGATAVNSETLYSAVLRALILRLDKHFENLGPGNFYSIFLDETDHGSRKAIIRTASLTMFGKERCNRLLQPPTQAESKLYQPIQAADWICGILGRYMAHKLRPEEFSDQEWADRLYGQRILAAAVRSSILTLNQQDARRQHAATQTVMKQTETIVTIDTVTMETVPMSPEFVKEV